VRPLNFELNAKRSRFQVIPTLQDVIILLEQIAPTHLAEPWDNSGFQIGSYSQEITGIFLALNPTLEALHGASERCAQLLLTHHPLIFKPASRLEQSLYPGDVIFEAVKGEISVVSAHTNLDVARGGLNDILAELLGLQDIDILRENGETQGAGLGRIGNLPELSRFSGVVKRVKRIFGAERFRIVGEGDLQIHRTAVVGGSGGSLVSLASQKGADLLITGDVSHHHALEAKSLGIAVIDPGHFLMEKVAFRIFAKRFGDMLKAQGWEVTVEVDEKEADPLQNGD